MLDADLTTLLAEPSVDPQILARIVARVLLLKTPQFEETTEALESVGGDPLWVAFLSRCLNVDAAMEARLDALCRALTAMHGQGGVGWRTLAQALALNGFLAEHLTAGRRGWMTPRRFRLCSRPPRRDDEMTAWPGPLTAQLVKRTIEEPARERRLAETMERLTPEAGYDVSDAVRAQYEGNPYPRWAAPPQPSRRVLSDEIGRCKGWTARPSRGRRRRSLSPAAARVRAHRPGADRPRSDDHGPGLSRTSLAYGARAAQELALDRVRFVQGDVLALEPDMGPFDVIVSTGVLHHMARPEAGLARLAGVLRPGGVIRLALYSERARDPVRRAHALIRKRGWTAGAADIRAFRARTSWLCRRMTSLAVLRTSDDFYSLSGCRDLVFHVQEHRYTSPQLGGMLAQAGLRLVGFTALPQAQAAFTQAFGAVDPLDMTCWDRLEAAQPTMFAGMYHLWGQKASAP